MQRNLPDRTIPKSVVSGPENAVNVLCTGLVTRRKSRRTRLWPFGEISGQRSRNGGDERSGNSQECRKCRKFRGSCFVVDSQHSLSPGRPRALGSAKGRRAMKMGLAPSGRGDNARNIPQGRGACHNFFISSERKTVGLNPREMFRPPGSGWWHFDHSSPTQNTRSSNSEKLPKTG